MIYFLLPDALTPSGGVRFSYTLVDTLNAAGFDAAVWHRASGFRCRWFANQTNVITGVMLALGKGDVLVVPEWGGPRFAGLTARAAVVMHVQNHFNVFSGIEASTDLPGPYPGWPHAVAAIVTSKATRDFVQRCIKPGMPLYLVPYAIDTELFRPTVKEKTITFMPRKRRDDLVAIVQLLRRSPALSGWRFEQIEGMSERDTADVMARAAIFLSGSDREGFGLPPAEAMAAGCYVVGFKGDGGREFMREEFSTAVEDQDVVGFVGAIEVIADSWERNRAALDAKVAAARVFITERYGHGAMRERLQCAFSAITAPGSRALQAAQVEVLHYPTVTLSRAVRQWLPPALGDAASRIRARVRRLR